MAAKDTNDRKRDGTDVEVMVDGGDSGIKRMIAEARERGYVTYDQLNEVLPQEQANSERIEDVMSMLSEMGINIVDDEEAEEAGSAADAGTYGQAGAASTELVKASTSREVAV